MGMGHNQETPAAVVERFASKIRAPVVDISFFASEFAHSYERLRTLLAKDSLSAREQVEVQAILRTDLTEAVGVLEASIDRLQRLTEMMLQLASLVSSSPADPTRGDRHLRLVPQPSATPAPAE